MFITEKLKTFSWINVGNPDHDDFERLQSEFKIDEDTISDILDPDEQHGSRLKMTIRSLLCDFRL